MLPNKAEEHLWEEIIDMFERNRALTIMMMVLLSVIVLVYVVNVASTTNNKAEPISSHYYGAIQGWSVSILQVEREGDMDSLYVDLFPDDGKVYQMVRGIKYHPNEGGWDRIVICQYLEGCSSFKKDNDLFELEHHPRGFYPVPGDDKIGKAVSILNHALEVVMTDQFFYDGEPVNPLPVPPDGYTPDPEPWQLF